ncbi:MAG: sugar phosphate isomerase/epimerase, partial [Actinomycetota bacterium]|nr:sugar phosphate isomerase/epimerase [Actinomycetota bacterium]
MRAIGVNTWVWTSPLTDANLPDLLRHIAALGFDAVELPLENAGDISAGPTRAILAETGLTPYVVGAMAPGRDLVSTEPGTVTRTQDYLKACVDLAEAVGSSAVCGPFYAQTGRVWRLDGDARAAAYDEWRAHLAPVVTYAVERGVRIGIEPLNRYETSLVNTVDQALE